MSLLLLFNQPPYHRTLLETAQHLLNENQPALALVTAFMACEIRTEQMIAAAFKARGIEDLEDAVTSLLPSNSLGSEKVRDVYAALTGDRIQDQPFWARFKETARLRNRAVHHGERISVEQAREACEVAQQFVTHLEGVAKKLTP